jgi:hypothetical protein
VPQRAAWLAAELGVTFMRGCTVQAVEHIVVRPGDDFGALYAQHRAPFALTRCKLQMLRLADPGLRLPATPMSDLGLARYPVYGSLPACAALKARLAAEQPELLADGIQLIVVQSRRWDTCRG